MFNDHLSLIISGTHSTLQAVHGPHDGWSWVDYSKAGSRQPKVGYMSKDVGSSISFRVDTSLIGINSTATSKEQIGILLDPNQVLVSVGIAHLRRCVSNMLFGDSGHACPCIKCVLP